MFGKSRVSMDDFVKAQNEKNRLYALYADEVTTNAGLKQRIIDLENKLEPFRGMKVCPRCHTVYVPRLSHVGSGVFASADDPVCCRCRPQYDKEQEAIKLAKENPDIVISAFNEFADYVPDLNIQEGSE